MITSKVNTNSLRELISQNSDNLTSLGDLEDLTAHTIRQILQQWLEESEEIVPQRKTRCRHCGKSANYFSKRVGNIRTQFGSIRFRRAYYICPHCHQSTCPLDERLNPVESLARLRAKVAAGQFLPVAELAKAWGLGSLDANSLKPQTAEEGHLSGTHKAGSKNGASATNQLIAIF